MKRVAIFDLDNTLIKGSSMFYLARVLVFRGVISPRKLMHFLFEEMRFIVSKTEKKQAHTNVVKVALETVKGKRKDEVARFCRVVALRIVSERLFFEVHEALKWHLRSGAEVWIATASAQEVADEIAIALKVTGAIGTRSECPDGIYTGNVLDLPNHGLVKAEAVRNCGLQNNWDFDSAFAYSDSENDLPLLCLVGNPVVVNANKRLLRIARKNNWRVISPSLKPREKFFIPPSHEQHALLRLTYKPNRDLAA